MRSAEQGNRRTIIRAVAATVRTCDVAIYALGNGCNLSRLGPALPRSYEFGTNLTAQFQITVLMR